ncbi:MAG TPA: hypothetical protein PLY93_04960 [Turneriella sp.]|nr:hypothetical protein [Turneriella sp.]
MKKYNTQNADTRKVKACTRSIFVFLFIGFTLFPVSALRLSFGMSGEIATLQNSMLKEQLISLLGQKQSIPLVGVSSGNAYQSAWDAEGSLSEAYLIRPIPELRMAVDFKTYSDFTFSFFAALSGFLPLTTTYNTGVYRVRASNTCGSVDYATCPPAAMNFVDSDGVGEYAGEMRSNLRVAQAAVGVGVSQKIGAYWQGMWYWGMDLGVAAQTFSIASTFIASRCSTGGVTPCAQGNQVRVVQSELKTMALYTLGPLWGANIRYERENSWWFAEAGVTILFLFSHWENSGYTNFVANDTQVFTYNAQDMGVPAAQNNFSALPSFILRFGVRL